VQPPLELTVSPEHVAWLEREHELSESAEMSLEDDFAAATVGPRVGHSWVLLRADKHYYSVLTDRLRFWQARLYALGGEAEMISSSNAPPGSHVAGELPVRRTGVGMARDGSAVGVTVDEVKHPALAGGLLRPEKMNVWWAFHYMGRVASVHVEHSLPHGTRSVFVDGKLKHRSQPLLQMLGLGASATKVIPLSIFGHAMIVALHIELSEETESLAAPSCYLYRLRIDQNPIRPAPWS
jgi:hypothetical protein